MARLQRQRFDDGRFHILTTIPTRWDDLDTQGHVNNVAANVILQEARVRFNLAAGIAELQLPLRVMVASLTVEYVNEMGHPTPVDVATGVLAVGRSSFTLAQVARQAGRVTLYAQAVLVVADAERPTPIPDDLRVAYEALRID